MASSGKSSPTVAGRWLSGRLQAVGIGALWALAIVALLVLLRPVLALTLIPLLRIGPTFGELFGATGAMAGDSVVGMAAMLAAGGAFLWWTGTDHYKRLTVAITAPLRQHSRTASFGRGGSAGWAGLLDEWEQAYEPGAVLLGRSLYDGRPVGMKDDRGLLTIASNRSGKGRGAIIPNLLTWQGSAVVIDPKGTNAAVTAARRGNGGGRVTDYLGQAVHVLDPFGIVQGVQSAHYNPMAAIEIFGRTAAEDIGLLADALVMPSGSKDSHWDEGARQILGGLIAHFKTKMMIGRQANLLDVRAALKLPADEAAELWGAMMVNTAAGGLAQAAAAFVLRAGENERGALLTTALRNTAWLDSAAMADVLAYSDFDVMDVKAAPTTIYVVLPPEYLAEHARFMRLFVNLTVRAASAGGKSRVPVLLIMDEFYSLGTLASLSKAAGALAGYGLKLWPILQNLSQLRELYPQNWQTFFANAGLVQIFGVNDRETAGEIVATLGRSAWLETVDGRAARVVTNLLEADEIEQLTERGSGLQVVLRSGKRPLLLRKMLYDQDSAFTREQYSPDPDHPGS